MNPFFIPKTHIRVRIEVHIKDTNFTAVITETESNKKRSENSGSVQSNENMRRFEVSGAIY